MKMSKRKRQKLELNVRKVESFEIVENLAAFLDLNDDCLEAIFEWMGLNDLAALSKTCKRLHFLAVGYFQRRYNNIVINIWNLGNGVILIPRTAWARTFSHVIKDVRISGEDIEIYRRIQTSTCKQLKSLCISSRALLDEHVDYIIDRLETVETLSIDDCMVKDELHNTILQYCKHLKRLHLKGFILEDMEKRGLKNQWLKHTYQHLELLQVDDMRRENPNSLIEFFRRNKTIKTFLSRDMNAFLVTKVIGEADAKLDELLLALKESGARSLARIHKAFDDYSKGKSYQIQRQKMNELCEKLNTLHKNGNYKRLYIRMWQISVCVDFVKELQTLEGLHGIDMSSEEVDGDDVAMALASFHSLKSLNLYTITKVEYAEKLSRGLLHLEELQLIIDTFDTILPFIRNAPKLQRIFLVCVRTDDTNINLPKLNKERGKLFEACKLTLYLDHLIFLPIKENLIQIKYPLLQIERSESYIKTNVSF